MAKKKSTIYSKIPKILFYIVTFFVCLIGLLLLLYVVTSQLNSNKENYRPKFSLYTIVSPSMTPVIKVYDVVLNKRVDKPENIEIGDIITYISSSSTSEGMTITHRVIEINKLDNGNYEYLTQGDNNSTPDSLYVPFDKVIGREVLIIPKLGKIQFIIASKKGWLLLILIPIFLYLIKDIFKIFELLNLRKKVNIVTEEEPDDTLQKQIEEKKRKDKIRQELKEKKVIKPATEVHNIMDTLPPEEALIIKETVDIKPLPVVEITEKDETNTIKPVKIPTKDKLTELHEKIIPEIPKNKVVIEETVEVLDTDELTSKIKEYDKKIEELNYLINDYKYKELEKNITINNNGSKSYNTIVEKGPEPKEKFLNGSKIKVTNTEIAKKKTGHNTNYHRPRIKTSIKNYDDFSYKNNTYADTIHKDNVLKDKTDKDIDTFVKLNDEIKDIEKINNINVEIEKTNNINKEIDDYSKVSELSVGYNIFESTSKEKVIEDPKLNLNPNNIKQIKRHHKNNQQNNKRKHNNSRRSKEKFVRIVKIR